MRRKVLKALTAVPILASSANLTLSHAQSATPSVAKAWPTSQIRMLIGYTPGGAADMIARIFADAMGKHLGQNIVVDNRPGAGGSLASQLLVNAQPDGYTIGLGTATIYGIDQYLFKAKYSPTDLTPITQLTTAPLILAVSKTLNVNTMAEFVAYAKANPGKLNYSSSGSGGSPHSVAVMFAKAVGVDMTHVPFKGGAPALLAVAQGDVHFSFGTAPSVLPMGRKGLVKMLGVSSEKRSAIAPDLPTLIEGGLPGLADSFWFGMFGPAKLPKEMVDKLFAAAMKAANDPVVRERLLTSGNEVATSTSPAAFNSMALVDGKMGKERLESMMIRPE
jgi:tripartite-type tricarboxylate transporter receptor subunit TctC